jgi:hypothetical protein
MAAHKRRAAARAATYSELFEEIAASLESVGLNFDDLSNADKLKALVGFKQVQIVEQFPELVPGQVGNYIRAVNRAMLDGALPPNTGKIMLYGAQLFMAAEPETPIGTLAIAETRALCTEIDAASQDRRHKKGPQ